MTKQEIEGMSVGYLGQISDVIDVARQSDDAILIVLRDVNSVRVTLELQDNAAHTLELELSKVLQIL